MSILECSAGAVNWKYENFSFETRLKHFNCEDSKIELFQCKDCDFTTYFTIVLKKHVIERHQGAEIPITSQSYVCKNCSYYTHFVLNLLKHVARDCSSSCTTVLKISNHSNDEIKWFHCDKCDYKTKRKIDLHRHMLHKDLGSDDIDSCSNLLPQKSKNLYEKAYLEFMSWCKKKQVAHYSETVVLAYFADVAEKGLKASLWPKFSMLKATLNLKHNVDLSKFNKVIMFIKRQTDGYLPKKSKVLEKEHIERFISDAPDSLFLMTKVALIFGVAGALRKSELINLENDNVTDLGSKFLVTIKSSRTKRNRTFTIVDNEENTFLNLIRHYISLRPIHTRHKRFFIFYKNNRCSTQPVGINTFSKLPSRIAAFLKLDHPHLYTGHCFRRSSASILSDAASEFAAIKRLGGWKSTTVEEGCVETSTQNEDKTPKQHLCVNIESSHVGSIKTETQNSFIEVQEYINLNLNSQYNKNINLSTSCVSFNNCNTTNLTINVYKNDKR